MIHDPSGSRHAFSILARLAAAVLALFFGQLAFGQLAFGQDAANANDGFTPSFAGTVLSVAPWIKVSAPGPGSLNDGATFFTVGGTFTSVNGVAQSNLARLKFDGTLDTTFVANANSRVDCVLPVGITLTMSLLGTTYVSGIFTAINGVSQPRLARLNADGSVDTTFAPVVNGEVTTVAIDPFSDQVYIGGYFTSVDGQTRNRIARLNTDGSLDTSFNPFASANATVYAVVPRANRAKTILIAGDFSNVNGIARHGVAELSFSGNLMAFNPNFDNTVRGLAVGPDGFVTAVGLFTHVGTTARSRVARFTPIGTLDPSFAPSPNAEVDAVLAKPDGSLIVAGLFNQIGSTAVSGLARLLPSGAVDPVFNPTHNAPIQALAAQGDGSVILGGGFTQINALPHAGLARVDELGVADDNWTASPSGGPVLAMATQPDGRIILGGQFTQYNGFAQPYLVRANPDGSRDAGFTAAVDGPIWAAAVLPNDQLLIGGQFANVDGVPQAGIARLNPDGSRDASFTLTAGNTSFPIIGFLVDPQGRVLYLGGGKPGASLTRLLPDGSIDSSFSLDPSLGGNFHAMSMQSTGAIVVVGELTVTGKSGTFVAAKLLDSGLLDPSFTLLKSGSSPSVTSVLIDVSDSIYVAGGINSVDGTAENFVAKLNADGSLDRSFVGALSGQVNTMAWWGPSTFLVGSGGSNAARLVNARDGSVESSFISNMSVGAMIFTLSPTVEGKILMGGNFTQVAGQPRTGLARLSLPNAMFNSLSQAAGANGVIVANWFCCAVGLQKSATPTRAPDVAYSPDAVNYTVEPPMGAYRSVANGPVAYWRQLSLPVAPYDVPQYIRAGVVVQGSRGSGRWTRVVESWRSDRIFANGLE